MVKRKIKEIKESMTGRKKKDLDYQHNMEFKNLEENYNKDLMELNENHDRRFQEFEERARKAEEMLNENHQKELQNLYAYLEQTLPKVVKNSKEYFDLRQVEFNLVKQERYI